MERSGKQEAGVLVYPKHQLTPEDLLNFCELSGFINEWESLGLDVEFDLCALQVAIMAHPKHAPVVQGTGSSKARILSTARAQREETR
jgi:hypothetical protein